MPTYIRKLGFALGATPVPVTAVTTQETALAAAATLTEWYRADQGLGISGSWRGRKLDTLNAVARGTLPALVTGGVNGKPYLQATGNTELVSPAGLITANASFSMVFVGNLIGAQVQGAVMGNNEASGIWAGFASSNKPYMSIGGAGVINSPTLYPSSGGAAMFIMSFSRTSATVQQGVLRVNGANIVTANAGTNFAAVSFANTQLTLFDASTSVFAAFGGALYESFLFSSALTDAANAADLALLEAYVRNRYALF